MKKRIFVCALALLLLCGCVRSEEPAPMIQPVTFYYRTAQTDYTAEDGVIRAEVVDLGDGIFRETDIFKRYFEGPRSKDLVAPFSQDTSLSSVIRIGSQLDLYLDQDNQSTSELDHTLTYACLAKTGLALDGISKVRIYINSHEFNNRYIDFTPNNILLYDNGEAPNTIDVTLYFVDESGSLLLPEKRSINLADDAELIKNVIYELCSPPQTGGMRSALPPGTDTMEDPVVQNGVCTVDLFPDFFEYASDQEQDQLLTILSIVNTLCKLENISQVQFLVSGERLSPGDESPYRYLDLSVPWTTDSAVIGPVREELGEFEGVLCLPGQFDWHLHRLTVRARARSGASREEALLQMLFSRTPQNGLLVPFGETPSIVSVSTKDTVCTVRLGPGSLPSEELSRTLAIRSVAATLSSLPEVESVLILEGETPVTEGPIVPRDGHDWHESWFMEPPTVE